MILDKYLIIHVCIIKRVPLAGLEPATSQLEAERAIRLRQRGRAGTGRRGQTHARHCSVPDDTAERWCGCIQTRRG